MIMFSMGIYESKSRSVKVTKETQPVTARATTPKVTEAEDAMQALESIEIFEADEIMKDVDLKTAIETLNSDAVEPVINHNTADAGKMITTGS